jgi:hypothetical protein
LAKSVEDLDRVRGHSGVVCEGRVDVGAAYKQVCGGGVADVFFQRVAAVWFCEQQIGELGVSVDEVVTELMAEAEAVPSRIIAAGENDPR